VAVIVVKEFVMQQAKSIYALVVLQTLSLLKIVTGR